jgi:hypothetical protein
MGDVSSGDAMGALLLGALVLLRYVPETQYLDAVILRKRGELKIAAKMKVEKSGRQGLQEKSEPEDMPFGRDG